MAFVSMVVVDGLLEKGLAYDTVAGFEPLAIHGDTSSDFDNKLWRRSDDRMLQPGLRPFLCRVVSPLGGCAVVSCSILDATSSSGGGKVRYGKTARRPDV